MKRISHGDSLAFLRERGDFENDIIFCDPPYALGSELRVRKDGKVDYAKASDFMGKWEMPTGEWWEAWFREAFRSLKHGGYCVLYGMDRQTLLFKYYAALAGFQERQSMYWYSISGFPKAVDLGKNIDKHFGTKGEIVGKNEGMGYTSQQEKNKELGYRPYEDGLPAGKADRNIYSAGHELAKKYDGYKYSCAPLKQTCETVMVFQKPYLTGSCLHDTLALENGDRTVACGALDIAGGRVPTSDAEQKKLEDGRKSIRTVRAGEVAKGFGMKPEGLIDSEQGDGRYPSQTFCDSGAASVLDQQSGIKKTNRIVKEVMCDEKANTWGGTFQRKRGARGHDQEAGSSKILHKCDFEEGEHDLYLYAPKVSGKEWNAGLEGMEKNEENLQGLDTRGRTLDREDGSETLVKRFKGAPSANPHPTVKPISLNERILKLFKTPNPQRICYPFAGSGSEIIGGHKAGFTDFTACELNAEYILIAEARLKHWCGIEPDIEEVSAPEPKASRPEPETPQEPPAAPPTETESPQERRARLIDEELAGRKLTAEEIAFIDSKS